MTIGILEILIIVSGQLTVYREAHEYPSVMVCEREMERRTLSLPEVVFRYSCETEV